MSLLPSRPDTDAAEDAEPRVIDVDSDDADDVLAALSSKTARKLLNELHEQPAPPAELAERVDTSVQNAQYHLEKLQNAGAIEVVDTAYSEKGREMDVFAPADRPLVIYAGDDDGESTLRTALSRLLGALSILAAASLAVQGAFGQGGLLPWSESTDGVGEQPADGGGGSEDGDAGAANGAEDANGGDAPGGNGDEQAGEVVTETQDGPGISSVDETPTPEATETPDAGETPTPDATDTPDLLETATPDTVDTATEAATNLPPGLLFFAGGAFAIAVVAAAFWLRRP